MDQNNKPGYTTYHSMATYIGTLEDYKKEREESYQHYHANCYGDSEYQRQDFECGYDAGHAKAINDAIATDQRERIAIAAMQGLLANPTWMSNPAKGYWEKYKDNDIATKALTSELAKSARECADALINELNTP